MFDITELTDAGPIEFPKFYSEESKRVILTEVGFITPEGTFSQSVSIDDFKNPPETQQVAGSQGVWT